MRCTELLLHHLAFRHYHFKVDAGAFGSSDGVNVSLSMGHSIECKIHSICGVGCVVQKGAPSPWSIRSNLFDYCSFFRFHHVTALARMLVHSAPLDTKFRSFPSIALGVPWWPCCDYGCQQHIRLNSRALRCSICF